MKNFQVADASIIGRSHRTMLYNNQDAYAIAQHPGIIVGVVCDGCGSGRYSEVGAQLGARFISSFCIHKFSEGPFAVGDLQEGVMDFLRRLNQSLPSGQDARRFIDDFLLFTIIGFVVKEHTTHLFYAGDGLMLLNDEVTVLNSTNRGPEYLSYQLLGKSINLSTREIKTEAIDKMLIGTDGVIDLIGREGDELQDGSRSLSLNDLVDNDTFYSNRVSLSKYFNLLTESGILTDDATVILLRKKQ